MIGDKEHNNSFWTRRVSVWHVIYWGIILLILFIFLLCVAPGRINDDAYHNFSFAATITSVVLAVVSIVYSLQSGLSSVVQLNSIKDVETKIRAELRKFSNLEKSIKSAVKEGISPLEASMGRIQESQDYIQESQNKNEEYWKEFMANTQNGHNTPSSTSDSGGKFACNKNVPIIFSVILYACAKSYESGKMIPFNILEGFFGARCFYCNGAIHTLYILKPDSLSIKPNTDPLQVEVMKFDYAYFGTMDEFKKQIEDGMSAILGKDIINALDEYFDTKRDEDVVS